MYSCTCIPMHICNCMKVIVNTAKCVNCWLVNMTFCVN